MARSKWNRSGRSGGYGNWLRTLAFFGIAAKAVNGQITLSGNTFSSTTGVSITADAATADMEARLSDIEGEIGRKSFHKSPFHSMLPPVKEGETIYGVDQFQINMKDAEFMAPASYLNPELYVNGTATPLKYDYTVHVFAPSTDTPDQEQPYYYEPSGDKHLYFGGPASAEEMHQHLLDWGMPVADVSVMKQHMGYAKIFENNDDATFTTTWSESRLPSGKTFPIAILQPGWTGNVLGIKDLATLLARQGIVVVFMDLYPQYQRKIGNTHVWAEGESYSDVGLSDCVLMTLASPYLDAATDKDCWNMASAINDPYTEDSPYKEEQRETLYEQLFTRTRSMLESVFTGGQLEFDNTLAYGASLGWQQFWTLNAQQRADPSAVPVTKYVNPGTEMFKLSSFISSDGSHWALDNEGTWSLPPMREGIAVETMWIVGAHGSSNYNKYAPMNMPTSVLAQSIFAEIPGRSHVDLTDMVGKSGQVEGIINFNFPMSPDGHNYADMNTILNVFGPFAGELMIPDQASNFKEDMQLYIMQLWAQRTLLPNTPVSKMTILQNCNMAAYQCEIGGQDSGASITRATSLHIGDPYSFSGPFVEDGGPGDSVGFMAELSEEGNLNLYHGIPVYGGNTAATFYENGDFKVGGNIIVGEETLTDMVDGKIKDAFTYGDHQAMFKHGVASGQPTSSSIVLWTKLSIQSPPTDRLKLVIQISDQLVEGHTIDDPEPVIKGNFNSGNAAWASRDESWTAKKTVGGLTPNTRYYYQFKMYLPDYEAIEDASERNENAWKVYKSRVGTFKTLPAADADVDSFQIGVLGCSDVTNGIFNSWYQLSKLMPDLVVHNGDFVYADAYWDHTHMTPLKALQRQDATALPLPETAEEYDIVYDRMHSDVDVQELMRKSAFVFNIGDHELANNYGERTYPSGYGYYLAAGGKMTWDEIKEVGSQAWYRNLPVDLDFRLKANDGLMGVTDKDVGVRIGKLAYLQMVDDYTDVDKTRVQEVTEDGRGVREVSNIYPNFDLMFADENGDIPETLKEATKEYMIEQETQTMTRRVQQDQIDRITQNYAENAETTWKIMSTGAPQTAVYNYVISQGIPPTFLDKDYESLQSAIRSDWPYATRNQGMQATSDYILLPQLKRELYAEGKVRYPFLNLYQTEGKQSTEDLHDIMKEYANNIVIHGDWHTIGVSQGFHYEDLSTITAENVHQYANGQYVNPQNTSEVIHPLFTDVMGGTHAFCFTRYLPYSQAEYDYFDGTSDMQRYNTPGWMQYSGQVEQQRSSLLITLTPENANYKWIEGGGWAGYDQSKYTRDWINRAATTKFDYTTDTVYDTHIKRVDEYYEVAEFDVAAVDASRKGETAQPVWTKTFPTKRSFLPADYPYSMGAFADEGTVLGDDTDATPTYPVAPTHTYTQMDVAAGHSLGTFDLNTLSDSAFSVIGFACAATPLDPTDEADELFAYDFQHANQVHYRGIFQEMQARDPQLLLPMGDSVYLDSPSPSPHVLAAGERRQADIYENHQEYWDLINYVGQYAGVEAIWDDHDYGQNNEDKNYKLKDITRAWFGELWDNYASKTQTGSAWGPENFRLADTNGALYRDFTIDVNVGGANSKTVQFVLLDDAWYRETGGSLLGASQMAWLETVLQRTADLRVIVSPSPIYHRGVSEYYGSSDAMASGGFDTERDAVSALFKSAQANSKVVIVAADSHNLEYNQVAYQFLDGNGVEQTFNSYEIQCGSIGAGGRSSDYTFSPLHEFSNAFCDLRIVHDPTDGYQFKFGAYSYRMDHVTDPTTVAQPRDLIVSTVDLIDGTTASLVVENGVSDADYLTTSNLQADYIYRVPKCTVDPTYQNCADLTITF